VLLHAVLVQVNLSFFTVNRSAPFNKLLFCDFLPCVIKHRHYVVYGVLDQIHVCLLARDPGFDVLIFENFRSWWLYLSARAALVGWHGNE